MKRDEAIAAAVRAERERILRELAVSTVVRCEGHHTKLVSYRVVQSIVVGPMLIGSDSWTAVADSEDRLAL